MTFSQAPGDDWISEQRRLWARKSGLRHYYETEIFRRVTAEMTDGPGLQLGTGAGFFSRHRPGLVNTDITGHDGVDVAADVHDLPFADGAFASVVGIDVLHHFARPARALTECARVLRPGGRLVLVEPWAGTFGWWFFRHVHHEDCSHPDDPWDDAFPGPKQPLDGNSAIPIMVLHQRAAELAHRVPGLRPVRREPFGCVSFVLTGGFQKMGLPAPVIRGFRLLEGLLPASVMARLALRALFVLEKQGP